MRSPLLSVFLCFAIQLQSLNADFVSPGSAVAGLKDLGSSSVEPKLVEDLPLEDSAKPVKELRSGNSNSLPFYLRLVKNVPQKDSEITSESWQKVKEESQENFEELKSKYSKAKSRLFIFDVPGVLRDGESFDATDSFPVITDLTKNKRNEVWINSQRGISSLEKSGFHNIEMLNLAGGMAADIRAPHSKLNFEKDYPNLTEHVKDIHEILGKRLEKYIKDDESVLTQFTYTPGGSMIWLGKERKKVAKGEAPKEEAPEEIKRTEKHSQEEKEIKAIVNEVMMGFKDYRFSRPKADSALWTVTHKDARKEFLAEKLLPYYPPVPEVFVLAVSGGSVDEKMLELLSKGGYDTISTSGKSSTNAKYQLGSHREVLSFISQLSKDHESPKPNEPISGDSLEIKNPKNPL